MTILGPLGFAAPWVLAALATLPVIWFLLRVVPPAPRRQVFPPLRLLLGLSAREESAARTPPWLLFLRLLAALLAILGLAQPVLNPEPQAAAVDRPLLLVIDDDWAAAGAWEDRRQTLFTLLDRAGHQDRVVQVLTTAPPADGGPVSLGRLTTAEDAREYLRALEPKPWPADHAAALEALNGPAGTRQADVVYVSNGLRQTVTGTLLETLQHLGSLTVVEPPPDRTPLFLGPPERTPDGLSVQVHRPASAVLPPRAVTVRALDEQGRPVGAAPAMLEAGAADTLARIVLPSDLRGNLARIEVRATAATGDPGAGGVVLLDERWQRRPVGIVAGDPEQSGVPLLSGTYYLRKALQPFAEVRENSLEALLEQQTSVIMVAGGGSLPPTTAERLQTWVQQGGVLVRFAGPQLAESGVGRERDPLLPVDLRGGGRTLGGVLSWSQPVPLAPFPDSSPFAGLPDPPQEVTVTSQVLAQPSVDLPKKTWAHLSDGTPLVTGARQGQGWVVLVHTTANPAWTNLPLSGLFPEMLRRLAALGQGVENAGTASGPLPPLETLDGFGRLGDPPPTAQPLVLQGPPATVGPAHPPGYYGRTDQRHALNLASATLKPTALGPLPPGVQRLSFGPLSQAIDLRPWFLGAALALLLLDLAISYALRGLFVRRRAVTAAGALLAALGGAMGYADPAWAQSTEDDAFALEAALNTRLAYVRTGIPSIDQMTEAGLRSLTEVLANRTSAELAPPMALDINQDPLAFFPLLYWPAADGQDMPDAAAQTRINEFLDHGGMILFDGRGPENAEALRTLLANLDIPPLEPVPEDHVLTRSFYLLPGLPGRVDGGPVWIESMAADLEGVSPVIIGSNDWAGAWARDSSGRPQQPVVPGGERGRELAYRAGVNMVMYALTGNYKADQVHLPAILERLTQ